MWMCANGNIQVVEDFTKRKALKNLNQSFTFLDNYMYFLRWNLWGKNVKALTLHHLFFNGMTRKVMLEGFFAFAGL